MYIIISSISLSALEWVFIAVIPVLLIALGLIYILRSKKEFEELNVALSHLADHMTESQGCKIQNLVLLKEAVDSTDHELVKEAAEKAIESCQQKYEGKWLPDLRENFNRDSLTDHQLKSCLSYTPALMIASIGLLASFILLLLPQVIPENYSGKGILAFLPLLVSLILAAFLINWRSELRLAIQSAITSLSNKISEHLPVYSDKAGLALLVNEMSKHENQMNAALDSFNESLSNFVSDGFKATVSDSIREVMEKEIAPPINRSADTLSNLATSLSEQQNSGMAELADKFSQNLNEALKNNFKSISGELQSFNSLMEETSNFIHDSIAVLENSRQQNILLNREVADSIDLMTVAKNDIANEMAKMSDYLEVIAKVTERMTSVYAGEDANLKDQISTLEMSLRNSLATINDSLVQSQSSMALSSQMREEQGQQFNLVISKMNQLLSDLDKVNGTIHHSIDAFADKSDEKVNVTLENFEQALADIVERLIYTTAEIKDAVEGLPLALKAKSDH